MKYLVLALLLTGCASSWSERDSRSLQRIADALENYLENHDTRENYQIPRMPLPKVDTNGVISIPKHFYSIPADQRDSIDQRDTIRLKYSTPSIWTKPTYGDFDTTVWFNLDTVIFRQDSAKLVISLGKNKNLPDTLRLAKYSRGCIHRADGTHEYTFWKIERSGRLTYSYPIKTPKDTAGVTLYGKCH